jgi:low temperature requirement protein LtrA
VTPLELFFDLVFVFGFTQVTVVLSDDPTWHGLAHGLLILGAFWWVWAAYAWLTNAFDAEAGAVAAGILASMAAIFVAALAVPGAFGRHALLFGITFVIVNLVFLTLYALAARQERDLLAAIARIAPLPLLAAGLIVAASFFDGTAQSLLWLIALVVGLFGPSLAGIRGWRVEPAHFVERHGLIVIVAIGESLIAVGLGADTTGLGAGEITAAVLGLVVAAAFWLAYFDFFPIRGQQLLTGRSGVDRTALARDTYTYLHLPMVVGIVLFAFAVKTTLAHVGNELDLIPAIALCGGPALYLAAYVALRLRISRTVGRGRFLAALLCTLLIPVALVVPALVALALVTVVWVGLHTYEIIWWREARAQTRALRLPASTA